MKASTSIDNNVFHARQALRHGLHHQIGAPGREHQPERATRQRREKHSQVSNWRTMRMRPAPSTVLTAILLSSGGTSEQQVCQVRAGDQQDKPTAPSRTHKAGRTPAMSSLSGYRATPCPALVVGYCSARPRAMAVEVSVDLLITNAGLAAGQDVDTGVIFTACHQNAVPLADGNERPSDRETESGRHECPPRVLGTIGLSVRPRTAGSPSKRCLHRFSLINATGLAPGVLFRKEGTAEQRATRRIEKQGSRFTRPSAVRDHGSR